MKTTLSDIATRVGVSKSLVSMYLNNHKLASKIAQSTKRRIDEVVAETNYRPSLAARTLVSGKSRMLGMVVGGLKDSYFAHMADVALDEAAAHGYQMQLVLTRWSKEEEKRSLRTLLDRSPDGILYCPDFDMPGEEFREIRDTNYPLLLLDYAGDEFSGLNIDYLSALRDAVRYLRERGHRKVTTYLYLRDPDRPQDYLKPSAFLKACEEAGVKPDLRIVKEAEAIFEELIRDRPGAVIFNNQQEMPDLLARLGKHPDYRPDLICGYCNFCKYIRHELVIGGIYSDSEKLVRQGINTLIDWAKHGKPEQTCQILHVAKFLPDNRIPATDVLEYLIFPAPAVGIRESEAWR